MVNNVGKKVVVGMSGGVDSSVAALLLKQQGYQVQGLFMQNWQNEPGEVCTSEVDFKDASKVCDSLDIPLHRANFSDEYWDRVFKEFLSEHEKGRTPNPDILCNREIKFKSSGSESKEARVIKSHHNVGGLPDDMKMELVEPLRDLFKDEVRKMGADRLAT